MSLKIIIKFVAAEKWRVVTKHELPNDNLRVKRRNSGISKVRLVTILKKIRVIAKTEQTSSDTSDEDKEASPQTSASPQASTPLPSSDDSSHEGARRRRGRPVKFNSGLRHQRGSEFASTWLERYHK